MDLCLKLPFEETAGVFACTCMHVSRMQRLVLQGLGACVSVIFSPFYYYIKSGYCFSSFHVMSGARHDALAENIVSKRDDGRLMLAVRVHEGLCNGLANWGERRGKEQASPL